MKTLLKWFPIVVLVVFICCRYLDAPIAVHASYILKSSTILHAATSNIPDVLFPLVCFISIVLWGRYFILKRRRVLKEQSYFCRVAGIAVPLAFILKWPLKFVFGRTETRIWLSGCSSDNFHWFHWGAGYQSFPSGHMMVFCALFAALWIYYSRYRPVYAGFILLLAAALVLTDYHYLSDVIAGGYLGIFTTYLTKIFFQKKGTRQIINRRADG